MINTEIFAILFHIFTFKTSKNLDPGGPLITDPAIRITGSITMVPYLDHFSASYVQLLFECSRRIMNREKTQPYL
jgi:hypothetical protein